MDGLQRAASVVPLLLLPLGLALLVGCQPGEPDAGAAAAESPVVEKESKPSEAPAVLVQVASPRRGKIRETLSLSGDLRAEYSIDLTSRVGAVIEKVEARVGDHVSKGEVLIRLEDAQYRNAALQEQQAHEEAVERAHSSELDLEESVQSEQLRQLTLERAQKEYERLEAVVGDDITDAFSLEEIEAKRYARDEAKLSHETAKIARRRAEISKKLADIAVQQAKSRWERALLELSYCEIRSNIDGIVSLLDVREGEMVQQGAVVTSVVNTELLYTEVGVPQRQLPALHLDQDVELTLETYPGQIFAGKLEAIYPTVDPTEGTVKVRIGVLNPQQQLLPGIYVAARIILEERDNALLVPKRARLFDGEQSVVFVIRDDKAVRVPVEVGFQNALEMEVLEHFSDADSSVPRLLVDDRVVIRGHTKLDDGVPVEVQSNDNSPTPARQS